MKKYIDIAKERITIEDLEEPYQDIASIIGIENYVKLCEEIGGSSLFIPKIENLTRKYIYKKMIALKDVMPKNKWLKCLDYHYLLYIVLSTNMEKKYVERKVEQRIKIII